MNAALINGKPSVRPDGAGTRWFGAPAYPLAALFALNLVDELDRVAFAALAPEIRDEFALSDAGIAAVAAVAGLSVVIAALPLGAAADRYSRFRLAAGAAALWALMTVLTGLAPALLVLILARVLSGVGRLGGEVVHPSILTDLYPLSYRPRVFQVHRAANSLGAAGGLIAGAMAEVFGWRAAFIVLALPALVLVPLTWRLREPRRPLLAGSEGMDGASRAGSTHVAQALRIPSIRRICVVALLLGVTFVSAPPFLSLFFENVHASTAFRRGAVQGLFGAGVIAGLTLGAVLASRAMKESAHRPLVLLSAAGFGTIAAGFVVVGVLPSESSAMAAVPFMAIGIGLFQPAYFTLIGVLAPARLRATAFAAALVCAGGGGLLGIGAFAVAERMTYRWATLVLAGSAAAASLAALTLRPLLSEPT